MDKDRTYAHQILEHLNIKMFSSPTNQILKFPEGGARYPLTKLNTQYFLNRRISTISKKVITLDYSDVQKMGYQITGKKVGTKSFNNQRVEYFLIKQNVMYRDMGVVPPQHKVEFNPQENWIRLIGTHSIPRKIFLKSKKGRYKKEFRLEDAEDYYQDYMAELSPFTYQEEEKSISIPEIPLILTEDGKLVCLPQMKDMPKIGIFGRTGMGKTFTMHYLADMVKNKWRKRVVIPNDGVSFQTQSWTLPWDKEKDIRFINQLEEFGNFTLPLPAVYLFQNTDDLHSMELEGDCSFRTSLPFKEIISRFKEQFFEGVENLGASGKYFDTLIYDDQMNIRPDGLLYVKNVEDIKKLVYEQVYEEQERLTPNGQSVVEKVLVYRITSEQSRAKLFSLLREIYNSCMFDVNTNIPSKWMVKKKDGDTEAMYPWRALLHCDLSPIFVTSNVRDKKYFPSYFRFVQEDLFKMQSEDPIVKKNGLELWQFVDEIHSLLKNPIISDTFKTHMKEGRPNRMSYVYATQYFGDIPSDIFTVTDYIISFGQTKEQSQNIMGDFDAKNYQIKNIPKLKKFEAVVAGKAGNILVVYDTEGNREVVDDGTPFKGTVFPPVSRHSAPKTDDD